MGLKSEEFYCGISVFGGSKKRLRPSFPFSLFSLSPHLFVTRALSHHLPRARALL